MRSYLASVVVVLGLFSVLASAVRLRQDTTVISDDTIVSLDRSNFKTLEKESDFLLVEFFSPTCPHCQEFAPDFKVVAKDVSQKYPNLKIGTVDVSKEDALTRKYEIMAVPTLVIFKKGNDTPIPYEDHREISKIESWVNQEVNYPDTAKVMMQETSGSKLRQQFLDPVCYLY